MAGERAIVDGAAEPKEVSAQTRYWIGEIASARKREKDWRKEGKRILDIHDGKKKDAVPFNILYSNTETWLPALYNAQPRPVVQRRFKDEDPLGKLAATAGQRGLEFSLDTNSEEHDSFDAVMGDVVLDGLLPGRGVARVKYEVDVVGAPGARQVKWAGVCFESIKWDQWIFGFAKKWKRVPWIALEHQVTFKEAKELFGEEKAKQMTFTEGNTDSDRSDGQTDSTDRTDEEERKTALVWEIWHKDSKEIRFVSPVYKGGYLKIDKDPLGLTGFYPIPEPLRFIRKSNDQLPVALYTLYENQAKELNRISTRINKIVEALKVRGFYDGTLGVDLENLLEKDDNTLIATGQAAALQEGTLEKALVLLPIEKLVTVLQQLIIARQQAKQVIYEITGISDILRGQSVASETATAQEIKNQWGTLRLKRMQREVQRYARDLLRIALEVMAKKLPEQVWKDMTGLPYATQQQVLQAQNIEAAVRSQRALGQQPDPKTVEQIQGVLQGPKWQDVLTMLRNDTQRMYRIDIETNSTVDLEATEDQKIMNEVFTAMGQFLQAVAPLVVNGSLPFQAAQAMLLAMVRRYRFGPEIEDYIKAMQAPQSPDAGKQAAEQAKAQAEERRAQQQFELDAAKQKSEQTARERELAMEMEFKAKEHQLRLTEMDAKRQLAEILAKIKIQEAENKLRLSQEQARIEVAKAHAMPKKDSANV